MENIYTPGSSLSFPDSPYAYEHKSWSKNLLLSGIDEVGRGCLAGPVVACCLTLKPGVFHPLLKDSKILTENQRNVAAQWIRLNSWYGFGITSAPMVDKHNIYQATIQAMRRAYFSLLNNPELPQGPQTVLIDAMPLCFGSKVTVHSFTKGESRSVSIAAASIMAKVMRDTLMKRMDGMFPGYYLANNKGYGAPVHINALQMQGHCLIHRKTFNFPAQEGHKNGDATQQTSLFC
jgi:ribonuclease HII